MEFEEIAKIYEQEEQAILNVMGNRQDLSMKQLIALAKEQYPQYKNPKERLTLAGYRLISKDILTPDGKLKD